MIPIRQSKQTSEELRSLAHDLLAIRASRFLNSDATLYDAETRDARILSDGALSCLQGAAELERIGAAHPLVSRRLIMQLLGLAMFAAILFASELAPDPTPSRYGPKWLSMTEQRLSWAESRGVPRSAGQ